MRYALWTFLLFLPLASAPAQISDSLLRQILTDDLVFKAETALAGGDRTAAFRLAELAYRYVSSDHPGARRLLYESYYYNDDYERLRDSSTRQSWQRGLVGHTDAVNAVAFSPDGQQILTGSSDRTARLWEADSGQEIHAFYGHTAAVTNVVFSPDGRYLLSGSEDGTAKIWEIASGRVVQTLSMLSGVVTSVAYSPDGRQVLTGGDDQTVKLWSVTEGEELQSCPKTKLGVTVVAFSPDGRSFFVGSQGGTAIRYDRERGTPIDTLAAASPLPAAVTAAVFSSDGRYLLLGRQYSIGEAAHRAELWDLANGQLVRSFQGHSDRITSLALSPDGKYVLTGSRDLSTRLWRRDDGRVVWIDHSHRLPVNGLSFSPDSRQILQSDGGQMPLLRSTLPQRSARTLSLPSSYLAEIAFSADGQHVTAGFRSPASVHRWAVAGGEKVAEVDFSFAQDRWSYLQDLAFSPDGRTLLVSGAEKRTTTQWSLENAQLTRTLNDPIFGVHSAIAFSTDGKRALTGGNLLGAQLWNLSDGTALQWFEGHEYAVKDVALSPDSRFALTGSVDDTARLWDARTGRTLHILTGHRGDVSAVAFSPDGRYLLTGSNDRTAKIWTTDSGRELFSLVGHQDAITAARFSPDGERLATISRDRTVKVWDLTAQTAIWTLTGHLTTIRSAVFSPDGQLLLTGSGDGTAKFWVVDTDSLLQDRFSQLAPLGNEDLNRYAPETILEASPAIWTAFLNGADWQQQYAFALHYWLKGAATYQVDVFEPAYAKAEQCFQAARRTADSVPLLREQAHLKADWAHRLLYNGSAEAAAQAEAAIELYRQLSRRTSRYDSQIADRLTALVEAGLDPGAIADLLSQLDRQ